MKRELRVLLLTFAIFALCVAAISFFIYNQQKSQLLTKIDSRLTIAAKGAAVMLGNGFHDNVSGP